MANPKGISFVRIGNIRFDTEGKYKPSAIEYLIRDELSKQLDKRDKRTLDVLHEVVASDPKTGEVTAGSIRAIVQPANIFLGSQLYRIGATMRKKDSFPKANVRGGENSVSNRKVMMADDNEIPGGFSRPYTPTNVIGPNWKNLSYSWLRKIGFHVKKVGGGKGSRYRVYKGSRRYSYASNRRSSFTQGQKHFWKERGRQGSQIGSGSGAAAHAATVFMAQKLVAMNLTFEKPFSTAGRQNAFTASKMKRRRARTYKTRSRTGHAYVVYSVTGDLLYPSAIKLRNELTAEFSRIILGSMQAKSPQQGTNNVSSLLAGKTGSASQDWPELIVANEQYRPWIGPWFAQMEKYLVRYLQDNLREDFGRSPPF